MTLFVEILVKILWFAAFTVVPFAIGVGICRALRVKEFAARLGFIVFTVVLAFLPFVWAIVQEERVGYQTPDGAWVSLDETKESFDPETKEQFRVSTKTGQRLTAVPLQRKDITHADGRYVLEGEDGIAVLQRTTVDFARWQEALNFGIDLAGGTNLIYETVKDDVSDEVMNNMVAAVSRRINPAGTKEVTVRRVGTNRIEVIVPGANPELVEETKTLITKLGSLEFSIVANRQDHRDLLQAAEGNPARIVKAGGFQGRWVAIAPIRDAKGRETPNTEFDGDPEILVRQIQGKLPGFKEILVLHEPNEDKRITGKLLKRANATTNEGRPVVGFHFNEAGGYRFFDLTSEYKPRKDGTRRRLAVMLNDQVYSAPGIKQPIGADGVIEGRFTMKEVNDLVSVLNAGALPEELKPDPISEFSISPTLGFDVREKGKLALVVSSVAVVVFMAVYYLTAGLVADLALILNLLFIVSVMAFVKAAFTLPGLAGLVLSAGMAVDANVLIYERIREEKARGASLRMAIHNGFDKAFVAIFDSNITTLLTAVFLYMIGTEQVKGFAVALFIGLVMNLYTAVYISRIVLNVMERGRVIKQLKMMSAIGATNFDFVGKQKIASLASIVLIVAGLAAFIARGKSNYDIDFTGGVMVSMQFNDSQQADEVRNKLEQTFGSNITVEELTPFGATEKGRQFRLRIANEGEQQINSEDVERKIDETFPGLLVRRNMTFGELQPIPVPEKPAQKEGEPAITPPDDPFAGGQEVKLTFTDAKGGQTFLGTSTVQRYLEQELERIQVADRNGNQVAKYSRPEAMLSVEGTSRGDSGSSAGKARTYSSMTLKVAKDVSEDDLKSALVAVQQSMKARPNFDEVTSFESSVAGETQQRAVFAILASLLAIVAYIWFRFENLVFGLAAVVALTHDVLVSLGCVALGSYLSSTPVAPLLMLTDFKINMAMIAAFLTIVGYSLNDTIVIFDRLREVRGKNPNVTKEMINNTVNQTLSRTILTALTVFITVVILYALGGEGIHGFAFCMVVGSVAGTYSTVYIASPLVLVFMERANRAVPPKTQKVVRSEPAPTA
jgi:SecD/SecF fusion protein